jgi:hypothetical protein
MKELLRTTLKESNTPPTISHVTSYVHSTESKCLNTERCGCLHGRSAPIGEDPPLARGGTSLHARDASTMASSPVAWSCVMEKPVPTTERVKQLEDALRESQAVALAGQFAAATMHEVNGPLEAISNLNYLVRANSDDGEQVRNFSGLIEEQLYILTAISRQTLSFYHSQETV